MYIEQLYTNCLAEAAYYIESEGQAAVIDPLRETEPYLKLAKERGATIRYVFETHFHADFVSGHLDLAAKTGAKIIYGPEATTGYEVVNAKDGQEFQLGKLKIRVLHTPGHTPESSCFLLFDEQGREHAVFTGDTLFVGDVGRPDLLDGVISRDELASMMYDSLQLKIKSLPDDVIVYPAHGPGSACGKNIGKETFSTIGIQKKTNYALQDMDRDSFIKQVTEGILPPPQYFYEDAKINKKGYASLETVMQQNHKPLNEAEFLHAAQDGAIIMDTRKADDFEKGFIPGSINIGLNGQFAVWVGTLVDINAKLLLVCEPGKEEETIMRLARIGYENIAGYLEGGITSWTKELDQVKSVKAQEVPALINKGSIVLDVRKPGEWNSEHVKNAEFLPLADFTKGFDHLDKHAPYVVHCAGGYRSMVAVSIMKKYGFENLTNVYGGIAALKEAGIALQKPSAVTA